MEHRYKLGDIFYRAHNLTRRAFAILAGVSVATVINYEDGYYETEASRKRIELAKEIIEDYKIHFVDVNSDCCGERMMQENLFKRVFDQALKLEL
jgi:DNA-binding XRE family transcriptional regulator